MRWVSVSPIWARCSLMLRYRNSPGRWSVRVVIPKMAFTPGRYRLTIFSTINGIISDWIKNAAIFDVEAGDYYGTGQLPERGDMGMLLLPHHFKMSKFVARR